MKKKLSSILGVGLALMLVVSLMGAFMPAEKVEAQAYTPNQWNTMSIPSAVGRVLLGADVTDLAVGSNGTTIYATTGVALLENSTGGGVSSWSTAQVDAGTYSAALICDGTGLNLWNAAKVAYGETLATLIALTATKGSYTVLDVEFNVYIAASGGYPYAMLWVDEDADGTIDTRLTGGFDVRADGTPGLLTTVWTEAYKTSAATWQLRNYAAGTISTYTGGYTASDICNLTDYDADSDCENAIVMYVGVGYTNNALASYAGDIVIGGVTTYEMEPSAVLRSTNGGQTFSALPDPAVNFTAPARLVAVSPDDPNIVAVVDYANRVHYSTNGGAVWSDLAAPATVPEVVYDIDISCARAAAILGRDMAVATSDTRLANFGGVYLIGGTTTWTEVGLPDEYDYTSVALEPNWVGGRSVVAVGHDAATTSYVLVRRTSTPITTVANIAMAVTAVDFPLEVGAAADAVTTSTLALPSDFDSTSSLRRQAYVGFTSATGFDDVYRVDAISTRKLGIASNIGIHSISFSGTLTGGTLFAGESTVVYGVWHTADPQVAMPSWTFTYKSPTGATNVVVAVAPDFAASATVFAGTSGTESAFSRSINGGVSYNQLSLIDTTIVQLEDIMPAPDNSVVFLSTNDGADASLWKSTTPPSIASWERVRLRPASTVYIIRLSADYLDDAALYYCDVGDRDIQKSTSGGDIFSSRTAPADIIDVVVESKDVLYMADGANVRASTNGAWFFGLPIASQTTGVNTLAMAPTYPDKPVEGHVLCGGVAGYVSLSTDGGASFAPLLAAVPGTNMQVVADKDYADNNLVYAGSATAGQGIYRFEVGVSSAWESIRALADVDLATDAADPGVVVGLAMHCGVLYAAWNDSGGAASGADRTLSPFLPDIAALTFDRMDVGATLALFNVTPSALRVGGGETDVWLWAINTVSTDTLMGYNDTMAKGSPTVTVPDTIGFDPNTGRNAAFVVSWNKVSNALAYRCEIFTDEACTHRATFAPYNWEIGTGAAGAALNAYSAPSALSPSWSVPVGTIPSGTTYYARLVIRDQVPMDGIRSPNSEVVSFAIETGVPVQAPGVGPTMLGPTPGGMAVPLRPGFSWGPMAGTTEYEFVLATDAELTSTVAGTPVLVSSPSWQCPTDLAYGTTYFWGVRASAPSDSAQSVGTFTTIAEPAADVFTCEVCGLTFTSRAALEAHITDAHLVAPVTPPTPGYIWAIIGIGAVLVVVMIALIMRTRRPA